VLAHKVPAPSADVLALGFAANRLAAYQRHIAPWLAESPRRIALSHRYVLSGLAYQSADGVPLPWLFSLNDRVPPPDLTIFIDTKPAVCEARIGQRPHRELFEHQFDRMRAAFLAAIDLLTTHNWPVEIIDGGASPTELTTAAATLITPRIPT
jgi:thymidylate kinase